MARLYWKFFFAILLAQFLATIGVGATFWLWGQARESGVGPYAGPPVVDTRSAAAAVLDGAAVAFKFGGPQGLRELMNTAAGKRVYAVDGHGRELLARRADAALVAEAHDMVVQHAWPRNVRQFIAAQGHEWTVFVGRASNDFGPPKMGANSFFGAPPVFGSPGQAGPHAARDLDGQPREGHRLPYITMVVGTLASLLLAAALAWYTARPIRALRAAFAAAACGDLSARFGASKPGRGDELSELGREFDRMSAQLRVLMESQQHLLHDVSHELRSPLARLQAAIGLAQQRPDNLSASLARIERESARMEKLIGELLTLSRLDTAVNLPPAEEIAIVDLIDEIAADARFEAEHRGRKVTVGACANVTVHGSPDMLWRAIENIVRNALKHSPEGGVVEVDLQVEQARFLVRVLDRGPGVAADHLEKIFLPFFRSNPEWNNTDGHGLGLAIAQRVIKAHGGTVHARNRDGGGLCVAIELPVVRSGDRAAVLAHAGLHAEHAQFGSPRARG